jgi:hypothetical protein
MKNLFFALSLSLIIGTVLTLSSCKKEAPANTEDDSLSAQDAATIMSAISTSADDGSASAGQVTTFTGKTQGLYAALCGVSSIDTTSNPGSITITYDGNSSCFGIIRSGTITVSLTNGTHWQDPGAQLTIIYNNLKATTLGSTYTINGTHTITNEIGGLAWKIAYGIAPANDSTGHRFASTNMSITFPSGLQRFWQFDRTRKWSNAGGNITLTDYTEAANNMDANGTNRFGAPFTSYILTPVASDNNVNCLYKPYQGKIQHHIGGRTTTVTFGTNTSGVSVGSPTTCGQGYYINYVNANTGVTDNRFVAYW